MCIRNFRSGTVFPSTPFILLENLAWFGSILMSIYTRMYVVVDTTWVPWTYTTSCVRLGKLARHSERWGAGVETQINVRGEIGGWGRVPFNETYAPSFHLRRGVGFMKFLENGTRPQPPTSRHSPIYVMPTGVSICTCVCV